MLSCCGCLGLGFCFVLGDAILGRHVGNFDGNGSHFGVREARGHGVCEFVLYESRKMMVCFEMLFVGQVKVRQHVNLNSN